MGPLFVQIYGQGETPMVGTALSRRHIADTAHPRHLDRLASVGVAQTPVQVRVADAQGRSVAAGEIGEVLVRGDSVMAGYWRNPEATAAAVRDGWLWTGDVGSLDEDGFLTLKDRSKDLLISGGSNIYPREVEEVLLTAPGVAEAAVVGQPDPEWGEVVVAFVVAQPGQRLDEATLDALCLERIARFKRPKRYLFVEALPKNNYGKVLKTELRARLGARSDALPSLGPTRDVDRTVSYADFDVPPPDLMQAVDDGLDRYNQQAAPLADVRPLGSFASDAGRPGDRRRRRPHLGRLLRAAAALGRRRPSPPRRRLAAAAPVRGARREPRLQRLLPHDAQLPGAGLLSKARLRDARRDSRLSERHRQVPHGQGIAAPAGPCRPSDALPFPSPR